MTSERTIENAPHLKGIFDKYVGQKIEATLPPDVCYTGEPPKDTPSFTSLKQDDPVLTSLKKDLNDSGYSIDQVCFSSPYGMALALPNTDKSILMIYFSHAISTDPDTLPIKKIKIDHSNSDSWNAFMKPLLSPDATP